MIGWILIGIGAWLVYDDLKTAKKGAQNEDVSKNGNSGISGNRNRKSGASGQKSNRERGVKTSPIGIPVRSKGVTEDELYKESIREIKSDKIGDSASDHSGSQSNSATANRETEIIEGGLKNAGNQNSSEDGSGDDGGNVRDELPREYQSNSKKTD